MKDFVAIDFETANRERTSICSVGLVRVENGDIREKIYRLIRPYPDYYSSWNTRIHGLTYRDTAHAAPFPEVWADISPELAGLPLVAHNSPFDEGCLKAAFRQYGMAYPDYRFFCTCRASRRVFGRELPNHQLQTVAARCGFYLRHFEVRHVLDGRLHVAHRTTDPADTDRKSTRLNSSHIL